MTAAHVVAGQTDTMVESQSGVRYPADVVAFDRRNDVAVLRVDELDARPLALVDAVPGAAVPCSASPRTGASPPRPARIGKTAFVLAEDAYGTGPVTRSITSLRGRVRHGDSGAPAVDARGAVEATIFAARLRTAGGYGVPAAAVRTNLVSASRPVSTGACAP